MSGNAKQYGLVMPKKGSQGLLQPRPSVFDDDSDSSQEGGGGDWVKKALKQEAQKGTLKKQTQLEMQRAVQEDPTVYQYDEVYDKMEEKKEEQKAVKKAMDKKPRYIQSLLKQAERRKREQERRNERLIQKEREAEGEEFKDKEAFVTSAYRDKLEEFRKLDEEEKRQDYIDNLTDVSKQQDLSGFYRHLYKQTVTGEEVPGETKIKIEKVEEEKKPAITTKQEVKPDDSMATEREKKGRHYRKRKSSSSESDNDAKRDSDKDASTRSPSSKQTREPETKRKKEPKPEDNNIDADTASSSSSDSESEEEKTVEKPKKTENIIIASGSEEGEITEIQVNEDNNEKKKSEGSSKENEEPSKKEPEAPKLNIWAKRTVGAVFDAALQRYYQRKANKSASSG